VAAVKDMKLKLLDVKIVFLYGEVDKDVYLGQPEYLTMAVIVYVG